VWRPVAGGGRRGGQWLVQSGYGPGAEALNSSRIG
jgi:hypothetical protein